MVKINIYTKKKFGRYRKKKCLMHSQFLEMS